MNNANRYTQIIERIFLSRHAEGVQEVAFEREDIVTVAAELGIKLPKNLGDVIYSFRYRTALPASIQAQAPEGEAWIIRPAGRSRYRFVLTAERPIIPTEMMAETKVPDSTPGIIAKYAFNDEQGLLAKLRYNRLIDIIDIFTGVTCYSFEIYIGVDGRGMHYVFPVQAKGGKDKISIVQIEQDFALCAHRFPDLICRPIAAQFMKNDLIALFDFEETENGLARSSEKHYRFVPPDEVTAKDLASYRARPFN